MIFGAIWAASSDLGVSSAVWKICPEHSQQTYPGIYLLNAEKPPEAEKEEVEIPWESNLFQDLSPFQNTVKFVSSCSMEE